MITRTPMHSKFISRLRGASWAIIGLGILVFGYLLLSAAATQTASDQRVLARIEATTDLAELEAYASGLTMLANNASRISMVLLWLAMLTLLSFVVLAGASLRWLWQA